MIINNLPIFFRQICLKCILLQQWMSNTRWVKYLPNLSISGSSLKFGEILRKKPEIRVAQFCEQFIIQEIV